MKQYVVKPSKLIDTGVHFGLFLKLGHVGLISICDSGFKKDASVYTLPRQNLKSNCYLRKTAIEF